MAVEMLFTALNQLLPADMVAYIVCGVCLQSHHHQPNYQKETKYS